MESALADPPENMEKEAWKFLCEKWSDKDYKYKLEKRQDKAIEDGSGPLSDEQLSIEVFGQKSGYVRGLGHGRNQVQHYLENVPVPNSKGIMRLLQERLKSNEESIRSWWEEFKSWSPIAREYNAKVDFLMQQISRRVPSIHSSS